jgi:hypothetical protein
MGDGSPKVARALARYLVALVARLESERGALSNNASDSSEAAFERALELLSRSERAELEAEAAALAAALANSVGSRVIAQ